MYCTVRMGYTLTADHPSRGCCIRTDLTISDECNIGKAVAFIDPLAADVICHPTLQAVGVRLHAPISVSVQVLGGPHLPPAVAPPFVPHGCRDSGAVGMEMGSCMDACPPLGCCISSDGVLLIGFGRSISP
jgi:hypothetical protein